MVRIKVSSRVSTEAWQFDGLVCSPKDRWSYSRFGDNWSDAQITGTVIDRRGTKFLVKWDVDGSETTCETNYLHLESTQKKVNTSQDHRYANDDKTHSESELSDVESSLDSEIDLSDEDPDFVLPKKTREEETADSDSVTGITSDRCMPEEQEVYLTLSDKKLFMAK